MNKAEIIRKISKIAGVPDDEAKKFFEIFLKHASIILKSGESIKIPGVGLFQLRVGKIERSSGKDEQNFIYSDLIVFIREGEEKLKEGEEIIFNVPSGIEEESQPIDSYFSLSIGKPIIPLKGIKAKEFFIPPSGIEMRSLIESKVSRLFEESEKITGGKETETILLKSKKEPFQIESEKHEEKVPDRSEFLKTREFENLSWDFGENLLQEMEEESNLDIEKDTSASEIIKDGDEWKTDMEDASVDEPQTEPHFEEDMEASDENPDEEIFEEVIDEENGYINVDEELAKADAGESETEEIKTEPEIDQEMVNQESDLTGGEKEETAEPGDSFLKNFQRVSSLTKEFNISVGEDVDQEHENDEAAPKLTEVRGGFQKVRRTTAEFDFDLSGIKGPDEENEQPEEKVSYKHSQKDYQGYGKRRTIPSLIVAFVVIVALAGIIYLYLKLKNENHELANTNKTANIKQQTKVIDRNYDVPVTYPYDSSKEKKQAGVIKDTPITKNKEIAENPAGKTVNETKSNVSEIWEPINAERIQNYIYKYPEGIVVQVSSWKSKTIAISEVNKYLKAGYTAFAEKAEITGMGLYYRVRVGYFNSLDEAKKFANGNQ